MLESPVLSETAAESFLSCVRGYGCVCGGGKKGEREHSDGLNGGREKGRQNFFGLRFSF